VDAFTLTRISVRPTRVEERSDDISGMRADSVCRTRQQPPAGVACRSRSSPGSSHPRTARCGGLTGYSSAVAASAAAAGVAESKEAPPATAPGSSVSTSSVNGLKLCARRDALDQPGDQLRRHSVGCGTRPGLRDRITLTGGGGAPRGEGAAAPALRRQRVGAVASRPAQPDRVPHTLRKCEPAQLEPTVPASVPLTKPAPLLYGAISFPAQ
jgi:hypothetical protein